MDEATEREMRARLETVAKSPGFINVITPARWEGINAEVLEQEAIARLRAKGYVFANNIVGRLVGRAPKTVVVPDSQPGRWKNLQQETPETMDVVEVAAMDEVVRVTMLPSIKEKGDLKNELVGDYLRLRRDLAGDYDKDSPFIAAAISANAPDLVNLTVQAALHSKRGNPDKPKEGPSPFWRAAAAMDLALKAPVAWKWNK